MYIWGVVFYSMAVTTLVAIALAVLREPRWYWVAVVASWVASFLGAFSIGLYILVVTFVTLSLALGHSLGRITRFPHALLAVVLGVAAWAVLVSSVDDQLLFFPLHWLLDWVAGP